MAHAILRIDRPAPADSPKPSRLPERSGYGSWQSLVVTRDGSELAHARQEVRIQRIHEIGLIARESFFLFLLKKLSYVSQETSCIL